jgi:hypothetical protein
MISLELTACRSEVLESGYGECDGPDRSRWNRYVEPASDQPGSMAQFVCCGPPRVPRADPLDRRSCFEQ